MCDGNLRRARATSVYSQLGAMAGPNSEGDWFKSPGHHVYDGIIYTTGFDAPVLDRIRGDFQLHEDDVLLSAYPKAGASWMQGIMSLIWHADDLEATAKIPIHHRVPFLEYSRRDQGPILDLIEKIPPPRIIKTHLPARFFTNHRNVVDKKTKVVYGMRNPKDTLVSFYNFYRMNEYFGCYTGSWSEFFQLFKDDHLAIGNWFDMVLEWWAYKDKYNIHFVKYEDLKKDPHETIQKVADFLEKPLTSEQLQRIVELTTFKAMRHEMRDMDEFRNDISPFMRKGDVGDWKNYFTEEESREFDQIYAQRMAGSGLDFKFTLD